MTLPERRGTSSGMTYDPYQYECSGDNETTTDQVYLRHIRMELQHVTAAIVALTEAVTMLRVDRARRTTPDVHGANSLSPAARADLDACDEYD